MTIGAISLTLYPSTIVADGKTPVMCPADLTDEDGSAVSDGEPVIWAISGSGYIDPREVGTLDGRCSTVVRPTAVEAPDEVMVLAVPRRGGSIGLTHLELVPPLHHAGDWREWDVFISHASEDKAAVAAPLAGLLRERGLDAWLDTQELHVGDSLRAKIDHGLANCRYGVVVLSHAFFNKRWPPQELNGLFAREGGDRNVVLPVWHGLDQQDVARYSPMLADRVAVSTSQGLERVADGLVRAISAADQRP